MRFAAFLLFNFVAVVFIAPGEAHPLLARRPLHGHSKEILVPVAVIPSRRAGILVPMLVL